MRLRRASKFHKTATDTTIFYEFNPGDRVMTKDGLFGVVTAVEEGPIGGAENYIVELDGGLGGGAYDSDELSQPHSSLGKTADLASDDYPELEEILALKPPPTIWEIAANRKTAAWNWQQKDRQEEIWFIDREDLPGEVQEAYVWKMSEGQYRWGVVPEWRARETGDIAPSLEKAKEWVEFQLGLFTTSMHRKADGWLMDKVLTPLGDEMHKRHNPEWSYNFETGRGASQDWCFAGETEYLTYEGVRTLKETVGTTQRVLDGMGDWVDAEIRSFGEQPLRKITLQKRRGQMEIYATAEHGWFVGRRQGGRKGMRGIERVITDDLKPGDPLYYQLPTNYRRGMPPSPFGIAHGIVFGDGTLQGGKSELRGDSSRVDLWGEKDAQLLRYFEGSNQLPVKPFKNQNVDGTRVSGLPLFFKDRPSLHESPSYLYGWLAGYFAADGRVGKNGGNIQLSCADQDTLDFVQAVCNRVGVATYGIKEVNRKLCAGRGKIHDYRVEKYGHCSWDTTRKALYDLTLVAETLSDDFFLIQDHRERFVARRERDAKRGIQALNDVMTWFVKSVEETDRIEEVFCAVVPTTESFVLAGNILTSNCRFRKDRRCMFSGQLDQAATQQAGYAVWIPQDRGFCPYDTWDDQKHTCNISEPGPLAKPPDRPLADATISWAQGGQRYNAQGLPINPRFSAKDETQGLDLDFLVSKYANVTEPVEGKGEFVWHLTAAWKDVQQKAKRIRSEGGVRIISTSPAYLVAEVRGDTNIYQSIIHFEPGTRRTSLWECFLPDAPVMMEDGTEKPISEVRPGDRVITHEGNVHRVVRAEPKPYDGDIVRLKFRGDSQRELVATSNHEIWAANKDYGLVGRSKNVIWKQTGSSKTQLDPRIGWVEIGELGVGDYLSRSYLTEETPLVVSFGDMDIKVESDLAIWLGWYTAEGYCIFDANRVGFSLGADEEWVCDRLDEVSDRYFGVTGTRRFLKGDGTVARDGEDFSKIDYRVSHPALLHLASTLIGSGARNKRLASGMLTLPLDVQRAFIEAWVEGDGHIEGRGVTTIDSANEILIRQAREIVSRLGIVSNVRRVTEHNSGGLPTTQNGGDLWRLAWSQGQPNISQFRRDGSYWHKITEVTREQYQGEVWDIEVEEDHSFRAYGMNVHNCGCNWAAYSWARSGPWKKYEGRMCSHVLATMYEGQSRGWGGKEIGEDAALPAWRSDPSLTVKLPGDQKVPEIGEWRTSSLRKLALNPSLRQAPVKAMAKVAGKSLAPGTIVQYRQVGTFEVVEGPRDIPGYDIANYPDGGGWYQLRAIKAPKAYRDRSPNDSWFWVGQRDVVANKQAFNVGDEVEAHTDEGWWGPLMVVDTSQSDVGVMLWDDVDWVMQGKLPDFDPDAEVGYFPYGDVRYAKQANADALDGVMIAIRPPKEILKALGDTDEDFSNLHVTLVYLGKQDQVDGEAVVGAVKEWASYTYPFLAQLSGYGVFENGDTRVLHALVDIPHMDFARVNLLEELSSRYQSWSQEHGFTPHLTLAYGDDVTAPESMPEEAMEQWWINEVYVAFGQEWIPIPLRREIEGPEYREAELKDEPEPALPYTTADEEDDESYEHLARAYRNQNNYAITAELEDEAEVLASDFVGDETEVADDPDIGMPASIMEGNPDLIGDEIGPGDPKLSWLMRGNSTEGAKGKDIDDMSIADAARQYLQKTALKDFTAAEREELINEGEGELARNYGDLSIEGTHYEALEASFQADEEGDWLW